MGDVNISLFIALHNGLSIILTFKQRNRMSTTLRIIFKGDTGPLVKTNQMSETEFRKKQGIYQPQRDKSAQKKQRSQNVKPQQSREEKGMRRTGLRSSGQDEECKRAEIKMMQDLDKMSKNQASLDMIHNSNDILRKQNEILEDNQKTIHEMSKNKGKQVNNSTSENRQIEALLGEVRKQVGEMKKIKEQIEKTQKQFLRTMSEGDKGKRQVPQGSGNIAEMNSNLKNLAEISKNQIEGLQNLEAIKNLQTFNIEGYQQQINSLKRQIVQYQKQSEYIERELKLRATKLQKLDINPHFDEQIIAPYQAYLKKRAESVDLHAIKEKMFEKLGYFDYGKFELDVSQVMADVKNEINDFHITCKQFRIEAPDIKLDQKDLKGLDLKLPSAIDEFKRERGIDSHITEQKQKFQDQGYSGSRRDKRKGQPVVSLKPGVKQVKSHKYSQGVRELNSKPQDLTAQVKYNKNNEPTQPTVLQNKRHQQKRQVESNIRKMKKGNEDQQFEKYLEYLARQELELIYKEKKERLQKKQNQLFEYCKDEPEVYLNLDLNNQLKREISRQKKHSVQSPKKEEEPKERPRQKEQEIERLKPIPGSGGPTIKEVGSQLLRQKLKHLLGENNVPKRPLRPQQAQHIQQNTHSYPQRGLQNVAQGFLGMINNTLTQVNNQLSNTIQTRYEQRSCSREKRQNYQRSPARIEIPKLQEFGPPPQLNMPIYNPMEQHYYHKAPPPPPMQISVEKPKVEPKIIPKNYEHLRINEEQMGDLEISQDSYGQDFQ